MNNVQDKNEHCSKTKTVLKEKKEEIQRLKYGLIEQKNFKKAPKWPQMRYRTRPQ